MVREISGRLPTRNIPSHRPDSAANDLKLREPSHWDGATVAPLTKILVSHPAEAGGNLISPWDSAVVSGEVGVGKGIVYGSDEQLGGFIGWRAIGWLISRAYIRALLRAWRATVG